MPYSQNDSRLIAILPEAYSRVMIFLLFANAECSFLLFISLVHKRDVRNVDESQCHAVFLQGTLIKE